MNRKKEGSVFQRKSDGRWVGSYIKGYKTNAKGKKVPDREYVYGNSETEVSNKLEKMIYHIKNNMKEKEVNKNKVSTILDDYLWKSASTYLRPKTIEGYEQCIRNYIKPNIGHINIQDLKSIDITNMIYNLQHRFDSSGKPIKPLSIRTIDYTVTVLGAAIDWAIQEGHIEINVCKQPTVRKVVSKFKKDKKKKEKLSGKEKAMNEEQLAIFMAEAKKEDRYWEIIAIGILTGLRPGELIGLLWKNVNFETGILSIENDLARNKYFNKDGTSYTVKEIDDLKRNASYRYVALPKIGIEILKELKLKQEQESKKVYRGKKQYIDMGFVFATKYGTPLEPRNYNRLFDKIKKRVELEQYTPHCLRHSYISLLKLNKFDYEAMQAMVGHELEGATKEYLWGLINLAMEEMYKVEPIFNRILGMV